MYCPQCDMPRPNDALFCRQCGGPLIQPPEPKKGKLWPALLFMAVMVAVGCWVFMVAPAEQPRQTPNSWFTVENGILFFQQENYTGGAELEIPSTVDGQTVTALSDRCFMECDTLETVVLPESLRSIGEQAFMGCDSLRGIKLTEQVESIGAEAFYNCPALEAIYIPESVRFIGVNAFSACFQLRHLFYCGDLEGWTALYPYYINSKAQIYGVSGPEADSYAPL